MSEEEKSESLLAKMFRGADEAMNPFLDRIAERIATLITDQRVVQALIGRLNPLTLVAVKHFGPAALSGAVGTFLPDKLFSSPGQANAVKNFIIRLITKISDAFEKNGKSMPMNADEADVMTNELLDEELIFDPQYQLVHLSDCPLVNRGGNKGKKGQPQQRNPNMIKLRVAIERGYAVSPCCHTWMAERIEKQAEKPALTAKDKGPIRSAFDAIDRLEKEDDKDLILFWVSSLTKEQLESLSSNLDSEAEARVLLRCVKQGMDADHILHLLENQSSRAQMKRDAVAVAGTIKDAICEGGHKVVDGVKHVGGYLDEGVAPLAETLEQLEAEITNPNRLAAKSRPGLWERFMRMVRI
ncbi:MAG: hypothetical protein V1738_06430 [Patescibacteria group bacterium]